MGLFFMVPNRDFDFLLKVEELKSMTNAEVLKIHELKEQGLGYKRIANELNIPLSTVKSIILRQKNNNETVCLFCGKRIINKPKTKRKKFCSCACKRKYLSKHPETIKSEKSITKICPSCGCSFISYKSSKRKFCSHRCYINFRYKREVISDGL